MNTNHSSKRLLSLLLALCMMLSVMPTAFAHAEGEEDTDHDHDATPYSITIYNEKVPNKNGTVTIDPANGAVGETITITATPDEGYTLTQVGYWTVDENGRDGKLVEVTADENGVYTFVMPASNVVVGAAFQDSAKPALVSRLNSNKIMDENQEDWSLYIANGDAYLNVGDEKTSVYLSVDKRFFDLDNVTMTLEVRQYSDGGYTLAGEKTYSTEELKALTETADETTETSYIFESVSIPISRDLIEGYNVYCVVKFNIPSWIDAKGNAMYRWAYTGTDTIIYAAGVELPDAMVWLYNLDANSYRGALVRQILDELDIAAGTVDNANLGQRIGYMIEWPGYEAVEDPYSGSVYDVEYMLMANLTEVQLDRLLDSMQDNNIRVNLKSIPTPWTAGKTFEELFDIMAEEDEVLKAAIALDKMIYTAEALDEETYGSSEHWEAFQTVLAEAIVALSTPAVSSCVAQLYQNGELVDEKTITGVGAVTFTDLAANTNYEVQAYVSNIVGRSNIQVMTVTTASGSSNPNTGVVVRPSIKPDAGTVELPFIDVAEDAYYAEAVQWAVKEEITTGTSAAGFSPDASCTRAQIVTFLFRCMAE